MNNNYETRLEDLKKTLDKATNLKYKAEARLEQLNNQKKEIIEELNELKIDPDNLEDEIKKLENEIEELFTKADSLLPKDIL